jgi:hypothetical protein
MVLLGKQVHDSLYPTETNSKQTQLDSASQIIWITNSLQCYILAINGLNTGHTAGKPLHSQPYPYPLNYFLVTHNDASATA